MYPKVIGRHHIILFMICLTLTVLTIYGGVSSPASYRIAPDFLVAKMVRFIDEFRNGSTFFSYGNSTEDFALLSQSRPTDPSYSSEMSKKTTDGWKTILFWNSWFGVPWKCSFGTTNATGLKLEGCPSWKCRFTYDRGYTGTADAILFTAGGFTLDNIPKAPKPQFQRWVWVDVEAPTEPGGLRTANTLRVHKMNHLVNWTMTYHSESDIIASYGHFLSLGATVKPLRPNLLSEHSEAVKRYTAALERGDTLENVMGPSWRSFVKRPKVVAWMSSHCRTNSRREDYIAELSKYITVDKYGGCGNITCYHRDPLGNLCWQNMLSGNYSFYLSMENNLCVDYITEKLYNPLLHNIVPVVWGGGDYDQFLPPHSYINARHYHPRELARLLTRLHQDPVAYGRYHVWRGYLQASNQGSMCELCHRLHTDTSYSHHTDVSGWRMRSGRCQMAPSNMFNSKLGKGAWRTVISTSYDKLFNASLVR